MHTSPVDNSVDDEPGTLPRPSLSRRARGKPSRAFERAIADVRRRLEGAGLAALLGTVKRISVVGEESFHDSRTWSIGLNPADVRKPYAAFHTRSYLLVHELGHHFAEKFLGPSRRRGLRATFGDYDGPYRRLPKPRAADTDHVSRYAMTHPAEDFAESFAVLLWRLWDAAAVDALMRTKRARCRAKLGEMKKLLDTERQKARKRRVATSCPVR
jgi:hypothetical protein